MLSIEITNKEKFNKVYDVDLSSASKSIYRGGFDGHVSIELISGESIESTGEHSATSWEEEYGFIVVE